MKVSVSDIARLPGLPTTNRGVRDWLKRNEVALIEKTGRFAFSLLDLPPEVQDAYRLRQIEAAGLPMGQQDDAARLAFEGKPLTVQQAGHERAGILLFVHKHRAAGLTLKQIRPLLANLRQMQAAKATASILANGGEITLDHLRRAILMMGGK